MYAFLNAIVPQMFRESENKKSHAHRIKQLIITTVVIAFFCSILLFLISGFIPAILGQGYIDAVTVVRYLTLLPLISAPRLATQYYLSSIGRQNLCMRAILIGGFINVLLNFILIFEYGWKGAVMATYISEIFTAMLMIFYTLKFVAHQRAATHKGDS
jgi:O-antigen/teichoic acid export membrane protein